MGLFDSLKLWRKGSKEKKEEAERVDVPTTIDNLKVGGSVLFPMIFTPESLSDFSEKYFNFTDHHNLTFDQRKSERWGVLNSGQAFIKKNGFEMEVIKPVKDLEAFTSIVEEDSLHALLELEEDEITIDERGKEIIVSGDKLITLTEDFSMLKAGDYLVQRDELGANSNMYNSDFRYIEAKSKSGGSYIYIFILLDGETLVFESNVMDVNEFDFV